MDAIFKKSGVKRVSVSLTHDTFAQLDQLVEDRGFQSRSQAISEMVHQSVIDFREELGEAVVAGTITLVYDEGRPGLQEELTEIQRRNIAEVISTQHVLLEKDHTLAVLLVQGPARKLKWICNELVTCKGVQFGRLTVTSTLLPPIHTPEAR
ncbi:MAG: nickel-responsive transcriptional regulator NikR [Verrucomicrobiota bacterium]